MGVGKVSVRRYFGFLGRGYYLVLNRRKVEVGYWNRERRLFVGRFVRVVLGGAWGYTEIGG